MRRGVQHPARLVSLAFLLTIAAGTALLMLPAAREQPGSAPLVTALFTATSAVCVTGLAVVDTPTYWSDLGHVIITLLTQLGGYGIMTSATLLAMLISRRLGLSTRLLAQAEGRSLGLANVRQVLIQVAVTTLAFEAVIAVVLTARFWLGYHRSFGSALWYGVFHSVSAFNNGGFTLFSDSLTRFVGDWWICLPVTLGVIAGGIGFPVLFELARKARRPATWSIHTRLTVAGSAILATVGFLIMLLFEWHNPGTFGPLGVGEKILAAFTQGTMPRSGGFSSVDYGSMNMETTASVVGLMFIGGGSASTAGGIRVTTFLLLGYVIWSEIKGERDVVIRRRRIAETAQRQAVAVALLGVAVVALGTVALIWTADPVPLDRALFETTSAFATVGLSTGITPTLPEPAQVVVIMLMFVGRVGMVTVASALALTSRPRLYRYPEERPIVG